MTKRPPQYADGLLEALRLVAEISGPLSFTDFSDATWKMLCTINERLAAKAADAFRAEANGEEPRR